MSKFSTLTIFNHKLVKTFCIIGFQHELLREEFEDFTNLHRSEVDIKISISIFRQLFDWNEDKTSLKVLNMFTTLYPFNIGFSLAELNDDKVRKVVMHGRWSDSDDGNLFGLYSFIHMNLWSYESGFGIHIDNIGDEVYKYLIGMTQTMQDDCQEMIRRADRSGVDPQNYLETFFGF